ncbi:hypothetical protein SLS62_002430 [Diatrype stigma]|uniref:AAA+ ATPase domain-containing protein n=1 Tax=Diatrype stigma TaxID=117547 RepID=A0AAN9V8L2_9PEZI
MLGRRSQGQRGKRGADRSKRSNQSQRQPHHSHDPDFVTAQKEAERRERILADQRRTAAKWRPKIPEVRKVNFEHFKNRYDDEEPEYAIDVLVAGPNIQAQIRREQAARRKEELARLRQSYMLGFGFMDRNNAPSYRKDIGKDHEDKSKKERKAEVAHPAEAQIQRVRVQSQPVLGHLTSLLKETERRSTPRTFVRPFKALVYFQPQMKKILSTLEEKWADVEDLEDYGAVKGGETPEDLEVVEDPVVKTSSSGDDKATPEEDDEDDSDTESLQSVDSNAEDIDTIMDSPEALRDMRCYVDFVEKELMPLHRQYDGSSAQKVKFDDLWNLFRVGDLIYMPAANEAGGRYHEMWRIYRTECPEPETSYPDSGWEFFADELQVSEGKSFNIFAYYIDHDGTSFGAVRHKFELASFPGERAIDSLEVFPVRYREDHENFLSSLSAQGRDFRKFLHPNERHLAYNAWTLTRNPPFDTKEADEEILRDDNREAMRHAVFVESDVIVDMTEAYHANPDWRPSFHKLSVSKSIRCNAEDDAMPIQTWFDGSRAKMAFSSPEIIQTDDGVEMWQRRENLNADTFLRQRTKGTRMHETNPNVLDLREREDLPLLPKRMFAYALRERRFVPVNIKFLQPIRREQGVFESLKILKDYKDIVRGLVVSHFQKKALERRYADVPTEGPGQDLIQGKGRGLVVLLHGVPGVGKTATAEAVAIENRKPLFVITCGDLGLTPSEVEASLTNVFRLAHLWDCVLLLDEADVFLSQRSKLDMTRNALVSVFLRVLEYYNGLLFLTTNRVGTIDEAFKSRIHMSLYYPPLDKTQTRDIFRLNIGKLREIEAQRHQMTGEPRLVIKDDEVVEFAARHFEDHARSTGCWNGRQIRNAFQIASSLAHYEYANEVEAAGRRGQQPPAAPVLDRALFEKVQMSTQSFDRHMKETKGFDADLAMRGTFQNDDVQY